MKLCVGCARKIETSYCLTSCQTALWLESRAVLKGKQEWCVLLRVGYIILLAAVPHLASVGLPSKGSIHHLNCAGTSAKGWHVILCEVYQLASSDASSSMGLIYLKDLHNKSFCKSSLHRLVNSEREIFFKPTIPCKNFQLPSVTVFYRADLASLCLFLVHSVSLPRFFWHNHNSW